MKKHILFAAMIATAAPVAAEPVCFNAPDGFSLIRCRPSATGAACEFIASGDAYMRCAAVDAAGQPVAMSMAHTRDPAVRFVGIDPAQIVSVACDVRG